MALRAFFTGRACGRKPARSEYPSPVPSLPVWLCVSLDTGDTGRVQLLRRQDQAVDDGSEKLETLETLETLWQVRVGVILDLAAPGASRLLP